ncbi:MAG: hypothetical protein ABI867_18965 [Kofleriaceae bacterium]
MKHATLLLLALTACAQRIKIEPVKVEPIHMTIDVNLHDNENPKPGRP